MMKSIQKSLKMYEMGSEMLKYWLQCSEKSEILKSDGKELKNESSQNEASYSGKYCRAS